MTGPVIHPKFHHFNLKTTRLQEMIDFYGTLVGADVIFQDQAGAAGRQQRQLQVDNFGSWEKSREWMRTSDEFKANPIGQFVDPERVAADHAEGMSFADIHAKAMAGGYAPEHAVEIPEMSS